MTDLATIRDDSALMVLPRAQHPAQAAIEMLRGHAEMMSMAYDLANKICRTQLVPTRFRGKAEDATAAILYGAELGLNPIQALQRVIAIHGMPTIESRTMVALLKSRGYRIKTLTQSDESVTVEGIDLEGERYESTWTIERATKAGYVPKPSSDKSLRRPEVDDDWVTVTKTWEGRSKKSVVGNIKFITDPQAMLKAKAQAEVCRDMAPEVLMGIAYSTEDIRSEQSYDDAADSASTPRYADAITVDEIIGEETAVKSQQGFKQKVKAAPQPDPEPEPTPAVDDPEPDASENRPEPETPQVDDAGQPEEKPPVEPPGAPTESTPGQTERVAAALGNARTKSNARDALLDLITALFHQAGYDSLDELPTIASNILKLRINNTDNLTDSQLKTVHNSLNAWQQVGTLPTMLARILEAADMQAEQTQQDAQQPTLDSTN